MLPLYCNKCLKRRTADPATPFHLSRCYHIVCSVCLNGGPAGEKQCPVCDRRFEGVVLTRNMPSNISHYFEDPRKYLELYRKISKFQSEQNKYYMKVVDSKMQRLPDLLLTLNGYIKLETQLRQQLANENNRIGELRKYIAFYQRGNGGPLHNTSFCSSIKALSKRAIRPRTPSMNSTMTDTGQNSSFGAVVDPKYTQARTSTPVSHKKKKIIVAKRRHNTDFDI
ncbi:RING finger protein narya [Scaptodrosophila lebanonensis]|uniref:RING finger protein narya n=1 Tax=Drosophila lebanonensis TaxID=7225 RepID=A0A6J2T5X9_DROLE|nr:RING finger protein narya [Scaptodrosophila lebanonensis]